MNKYHNENVMYVKSFDLLVSDINKSLNFYLKSLGLKLLRQEENKNALKKEKTTGLYHFALLLKRRSDLGNLLNNFIKNKTYISGGSDHGVSEAIYLNDPDGNGIEIYYDKDESLWPYLNNKLKMVSEPLDYEELISLKNTDNFIMPEDTIIGHMHFHVSNLNDAKNFFVNILGFKLIENMHSALFISDNNYHHHIGFNIWNGINIKNRDSNMVGLISYDLNIPENKKQSLYDILNNNNIEIYKENNKEYILDPNLVKVYI